MGYWLADTPHKELVNLTEESIYNQQTLANDLGMSLDSLGNTMSNGLYGLNQAMGRMSSDLSGQMASNTAHLGDTINTVGAGVTEATVNAAGMISGSMFLSAMTTSGLISKAIKRQTVVLRNEMLEQRSEQMLTRRAITAAQMLTFHELKELRHQTAKNHAESVWALMGQSTIIKEIHNLLQHPRLTEAIEIASSGSLLMQRGMYPEALKALTDAKEMVYDTEPGIAVSLGFVYGHLGDAENGEERFRHATRLSDDHQFNAYCLGLLADLFWSQGDKAKALETSSEAVIKSPDDLPTLINHSALLAESGKKAEAINVITAMVENGMDCAKPLLDRKTFWRHEIVPVIQELLEKNLDPETEGLNADIVSLKNALMQVQQDGAYKQFQGHTICFEKALEEIQAWEERKDRTGKKEWLKGVKAAHEALINIEQDARNAAKANQKFQELASTREGVERFLDNAHMRSTALIRDTDHHPQVRMLVESIKTSLGGIEDANGLLAACELVINTMDARIRESEQAYIKANEAFLTKLEQGKVGDQLMSYIDALSRQVEKIRVESFSEPFQICPKCYSRWPRDNKHCGQCGLPVAKRLEEKQ